jgi:histidine triad (HIT) family protein
MDSCIFCKIANKQTSSTLIFEDEDIIAFHDIAPVAPVHVLIVPKVHIKSITDVMDLDIIKKIFQTAQKLAADLGVEKDGFRIVNNCGPNGGQTVDHLHFHLIGGRKLGIMG